MDFSKLPLFSLIQQKMAYVDERHAVIAENIANANTPKYKAKDLKSVDFGKLVKASSGKLQMTATDPRHIQPPGAGSTFATETVKSWDTSPNGNSVDLVEQSQKMQANAGDQQAAIRTYAKVADLIRTAVSDK
jgi:flagellar basal-body rod protein FlgB